MKRFLFPFTFGVFSFGFLLTIILCVYHLVTAPSVPFSGPGSYVFKAEAARSYVIMHREKGLDDGKFFEQDDDAVENARVEVVEVKSGAKIPVSPSSFSSKSGSEEKKGLVNFDAPMPGEYRITISDTPPARFLIQADDFFPFLIVIIVSGFGMVATGLISLISFFVILAKKSSSV